MRLPASAACLGRHLRLAGRGPNSFSLLLPQAAVVAVAAFSPYRHLSAPGKEIFLEISLPRTLEGGKGGCTMTFEQVVLLLTLLGGVIYVTFEITWTVSHSDRRKKK